MFTLIECLYLFLTLSFALLGAGASPILAHRDDDHKGLSLRAQLKSLPFDLGASLPSSSSNKTDLSELPQSCSAYTQGDNAECKTTMTATNVTYDDCGDAFTICYCQGANMTMDVAVDRLGRVPVGLRRYVGTTLVLPADDTPHAYTLVTGDLHMFGDNQVDTWVHESFHAYDYATGTPFSASQGWLQSLLDDSCAPDNYSTTNQVEDFAQVGVVMVYELLHQQMPQGLDKNCMGKQMDYMSKLPVLNSTTLFGNTCALDPSIAAMGAKHTLSPNNPPTQSRVQIPVPVPASDPAADPNTENTPSGAVKSAAFNISPANGFCLGSIAMASLTAWLLV